ncbi:MATE family efflux transporter [Bacteroides thetaiotaomicron]|nr:MATE family efflux transporter [Bacteroides thetaiotaomicron]
MEHFGERSLAITNIVRNISSFLFLFVQAFASVVSSLVGNLIGENKGNSILYVCKKVIFLCYMTILPIMVLFLFFPSSALRIYSDNTVLVFEAIPTLKVMLTSYLIAVPTFVFLVQFRE